MPDEALLQQNYIWIVRNAIVLLWGMVHNRDGSRWSCDIVSGTEAAKQRIDAGTYAVCGTTYRMIVTEQAADYTGEGKYDRSESNRRIE